VAALRSTRFAGRLGEKVKSDIVLGSMRILDLVQEPRTAGGLGPV
jgi:hypothetical protein